MSATKRTVMFVSDHTGITAEVLGQSILARFEPVPYEYLTRPFVDNPARAREVADEVAAVSSGGNRAIVFCTLSDPHIMAELKGGDALVLDLFSPHLSMLQTELGIAPSPQPGRYHSIADLSTYQTRIDAVEFALVTDDGLGTRHYERADLIIIGVSRAGKTPTCLFMALQYGLRSANYPLADADFEASSLPDGLRAHRGKLFGLSIDPLRLHQLRSERKAGSHYASIERCEREVKHAEDLFQRTGVPYLNATTSSIEELAAKIMQVTGVKRRLR